MQPVQSSIYAPVSAGFPFLAVIFNADGRVAMAEPFWSRESAERFIADLASGLQARASEPSTAPPERAQPTVAPFRAAQGRARGARSSRRG